MAENDIKDAFLEAHFAAARRVDAGMPLALEARMLADAARVQAQQVPVMRPAAETPRRGIAGAALGLVQQFMRALGGWPALGGLAAASAAGVWIGVSPPDFLPDPVGLMVQYDTEVNMLDSYALSSVLPEEG